MSPVQNVNYVSGRTRANTKQETVESDRGKAHEIADKRTWDDNGIFSGLELLKPPPVTFDLSNESSNGVVKNYYKMNYRDFDPAELRVAEINSEPKVYRILLRKFFRTQGKASSFFRLVKAGLTDEFQVWPNVSDEDMDRYAPSAGSNKEYARWRFEPREVWIEKYVEELRHFRKSTEYRPWATSRHGISSVLRHASASVDKYPNEKGIYEFVMYYNSYFSEEFDEKEREMKKKALDL